MEEDWDNDWDSPSTAAPRPPATLPSHSFGRGRLASSFGQDNNNKFQDRHRSPDRGFRDHDRTSLSDYIKIDPRSIGALIGKAGSNINCIRDKCNVKIMVPNRDEMRNQSFAEVKIIGSSKIDIDKAIQMIEQSCNSCANLSASYGSDSQKRCHDQFRDRAQKSWKREHDTSPQNSIDEDENNNEKPLIDWNLIRSLPLQNMEKFKDQPPVVKDFYVEDAEITRMSRDEVKQYRKQNFDIIVDFFKKENLSYGLSSEAKTQENRSGQELEDQIFKVIPKPVKTIEQAFRNYPQILEECKRQNFNKPTPVQAQLWPILLKGLDCVGIAQTGTGKTLAFLLPALVHIDNQITPREERVGPNVLVLSPTRELAIQIEKEVKKINSYQNF
ncbi:putative ATP-dependent RNA helicase DDX43 [Brachionus plicatilis]|uniref:Putative ATP-dependent RNA helicase DDX43 n=1 Tax=Brachionus plicatilis TaxID=10195 RepID=A0A3M7PCE9_BRAPC|nr:putative ATP-dependent RNA helicase DDX43 [Brachionus plicatilis]